MAFGSTSQRQDESRLRRKSDTPDGDMFSLQDHAVIDGILKRDWITFEQLLDKMFTEPENPKI